jgi:hypothetical protein
MRILKQFLVGAAVIGGCTSCGDVVRDGRSPSYLVIDSMSGLRGAATVGTPASVLTSDVITNVTTPPPCTTNTPCPTIFGDAGQAIVHVALKDAGTQASPNSPSQMNAVTIDRYHVEYIRADGRNTPGVDVPYAFDGAVTTTISASTTFGFELVRVAAKEETPLVQLRTSPTFLTVLARVTFYGHDQAGNQVNVTGMIQIDFGNFGDGA